MTDDLLEVGRITKAHGIRGDVIVHLWSEILERLSPGSTLTTANGPLTVRSSQPYQDHHLVHFEGIDDRGAAEGLRGLVLLAEPLEQEGVLFVHELVGCEVVLLDGTVVGTVEAVESNPASDLCVLDDGRLIPLTFVVEHVAGERLVIDPPLGLLD